MSMDNQENKICASPTPLWLRMAGLLIQTGRKGIAVLFDQALVSGTSFITMIVVGRALGKVNLGLYVLAYSVLVICLEVQNSFIGSAYTISISSSDPSSRPRQTGSALLLSTVLSVLAATCIMLVGSMCSGWRDIEVLRPLLWVLSFATGAVIIKEFARRACFAYFQIGSAICLDGIASAIQISGILVIAHFGLASVRSIYCIIGCASAGALALWMTTWRDRVTISCRGALESLRNSWSFGAWVLTGNLAFVLGQQIYPWILAWLMGRETTGSFAACLGVLALINPFVSAVGNYLGPLTAAVSRRGSNELYGVVRKASLLVFGVVGAFTLAVSLGGNHLLRLLYGSAYAVDPHIIVVLAGSVLAGQSTLAIGYGFWAIGRPDINCKINAISATCAAVAGPFMVNMFGMRGAAYGLLAANTVVSIIRIMIFQRFTRAKATHELIPATLI
jgi:O-antigen/teichoic acid export membrane protein